MPQRQSGVFICAGKFTDRIAECAKATNFCIGLAVKVTRKGDTALSSFLSRTVQPDTSNIGRHGHLRDMFGSQVLV